jgi:hypothetical protein
MKRVFRHGFVALLSLAAIGGIDAACAHNDQSIFIRGVLSPPNVASTGATVVCTYTADPTLLEEGFGILDISLNQDYTPALLIGNQLVAQANPDQLRTESNRVELKDAVVTVTTAGDLPGVAGGTTLISYTEDVSGFVDPAAGATPSYAVVSADILAFSRIMTALPVPTNGGTITLVSHVKFQGMTLGRTNVETNELDFPVNICSGCLVQFPIGSDNPLAPTQPNCSATLMSGGSSSVTQPCIIGQDQPVDCRLCQGNPACDPANRATTGGG